MIGNKGEDGSVSPSKVRQVASVHKKENVVADGRKIPALLEAIGVYDTSELPPGYKPPDADLGRGLLIRGGSGSRWLNRISSMIFIALALVVVLAFWAFGNLFNRPAQDASINCVWPAPGDILGAPDATGRRALSGNPKPPVLGDMASVATGSVGVPSGAGEVVMGEGIRTNVLPTAAGRMEVRTGATGVEFVSVSFGVPVSVCPALQATGLIRTEIVKFKDNKIVKAPAEGALVAGWELLVKGDSAAVNALELVRSPGFISSEKEEQEIKTPKASAPAPGRTQRATR